MDARCTHAEDTLPFAGAIAWAPAEAMPFDETITVSNFYGPESPVLVSEDVYMQGEPGGQPPAITIRNFETDAAENCSSSAAT